MSFRRVLTILNKDLVDAFRDGRIYIGLFLPIGLAVLYNMTAPERNERPSGNIVIVNEADTGLKAALVKATDRTVDLEIRTVDSAAEARRLVRADDEDMAVVAGARGSARALVLLPSNATPTAQTIAGIVPDAVAALAGRPPASEVRVATVAIDRAEQTPAQVIEPRVLFIAGSIVLLAGFVALLIVPIQTAEELETGTFGALRLAATGTEILTAKALGGMIYGIAGTAIIVGITQPELPEPLLFAAASVLLVLSMVGFGMVLGLVTQNANLINSYGAFLVFPLVGLAIAVMFVTDGLFATILDLLPFSQAMKLLVNGLAPEQPFEITFVPWLVIVLWAVLGFALLARYASRREV